MIKCRRCGKGPNEVRAVLQRVNPKGVEGIWECRPICGAQMSDADAIDAAIQGVFDEPEKGKPDGCTPVQTCLKCGHNNLAFGMCQEQVDIASLTPTQMVELHQEFWDGPILRCGCHCVFPAPEGGGEVELEWVNRAASRIANAGQMLPSSTIGTIIAAEYHARTAQPAGEPSDGEPLLTPARSVDDAVARLRFKEPMDGAYATGYNDGLDALADHVNELLARTPAPSEAAGSPRVEVVNETGGPAIPAEVTICEDAEGVYLIRITLAQPTPTEARPIHQGNELNGKPLEVILGQLGSPASREDVEKFRCLIEDIRRDEQAAALSSTPEPSEQVKLSQHEIADLFMHWWKSQSLTSESERSRAIARVAYEAGMIAERKHFTTPEPPTDVEQGAAK